MTTPTQQSYVPPIATGLNFLDRLHAAYAAAGLPTPTQGQTINTLLAAEATVDGIAGEIARGTIDTDDAHAWLEDALSKVSRAYAADRLKTALGRHRDVALRAATPDLTAKAAQDCRPAFDQAAATLTRAAAKLPTGNDPLDLAAVIDADATRAMKDARHALATLAVFAGLFEPRVGLDLDAEVIRVLPVVSFPTVPVERVARISGRPLDHDATRDTVREFMRHLIRHGTDTALIRLARGEYEGLTLALAPSIPEHAENGRRAEQANRRIPTDSGPKVVVA